MANEEFIKRVVEKASNGGKDAMNGTVDNKVLLFAISELAEAVHNMPCWNANDPTNPIIRLNRVEWFVKVIIGILTLVIAPVGVWAAISIIGKVSELLVKHN